MINALHVNNSSSLYEYELLESSHLNLIIFYVKIAFLFPLPVEHDSKTLRINDIHALVHQIPEPNFEMLDMLISHLKK